MHFKSSPKNYNDTLSHKCKNDDIEYISIRLLGLRVKQVDLVLECAGIFWIHRSLQYHRDMGKTWVFDKFPQGFHSNFTLSDIFVSILQTTQVAFAVVNMNTFDVLEIDELCELFDYVVFSDIVSW